MTLFKNKLNRTLTWNYRIKEKIYTMNEEQEENYINSMKKIFGDDYNPNLEPDIFYEVIEVYYDDNNKIIAWSECSLTPWRKLKEGIYRRIKKI